MAAPMPVAFYDPTNPRTRDRIWELIAENYLADGIRVFWLDACEPELNPAQPANLALHAGPGAEVANIYPRDNARLFAEGMAAAGQDPTVLLCRSAWAGSQQYGAAVWSGDIPATWRVAAPQVRAGLNIAISGIPWWTTDIGGFHGGDPADPAYRELIVRWFQYGAFCPLFRLHGDRDPGVPTGLRDDRRARTRPGPTATTPTSAIAATLRLRERLRPYIHDADARRAERRPAADAAAVRRLPATTRRRGRSRTSSCSARTCSSPRCSSRAPRERDVYLPAGRSWTDAATGASHAGGATVTVPLPSTASPSSSRKEQRFLMSSAKQGGPVRPSTSVWRPLGPGEITITGGIWQHKQRVNADTTLGALPDLDGTRRLDRQLRPHRPVRHRGGCPG